MKKFIQWEIDLLEDAEKEFGHLSCREEDRLSYLYEAKKDWERIELKLDLLKNKHIKSFRSVKNGGWESFKDYSEANPDEVKEMSNEMHKGHDDGEGL